MKIRMALTALVLAVLTTGCSSWQGQVGKTTEEFVDSYGRNCTAVKWGDSASLDCDYPLAGQ